MEINEIYLGDAYKLIKQVKAEIKRVNAILRTTKNPREYKQNKKYLERLERKLRNYARN